MDCKSQNALLVLRQTVPTRKKHFLEALLLASGSPRLVSYTSTAGLDDKIVNLMFLFSVLNRSSGHGMSGLLTCVHVKRLTLISAGRLFFSQRGWWLETLSMFKIKVLNQQIQRIRFQNDSLSQQTLFCTNKTISNTRTHTLKHARMHAHTHFFAATHTFVLCSCFCSGRF